MENLETLGHGIMLSSTRRGHANTRAALVAFRIPFKTYTLSTFCINTLIISSTYFGTISAIADFNVTSTGYDCSSNMICWGDAHRYDGTSNTSNIQVGRLSLISELSPSQDSGIAYYHQAVTFLNLSSRQVVSFNTSFAIDIVMADYPQHGDGMTFVISADYSLDSLGENGEYLGIFASDQTTHFKSIVVEFDGFQNIFKDSATDINNNHLSLDIGNMSFVAAENASDVSVDVWSNASTIYAWVEYSQKTQQFEARVSNNNSRPVNPLISYAVDLSTYVEEYMWVGFSAGNGFAYSNYYIGDWDFTSWFVTSDGISSEPGPAPAPVSSQAPPRNRKNMGAIIGVSLGVSAALVLVCIPIVIFARRKSYSRQSLRLDGLGQSFQPDDSIIQLEGMPERFSFEELSEATGAFSTESKLGNGGFGTVHRGVLPSSSIPMAVKKIHSESSQGEREFMAEVSIISRLSHRNLIQLLGWCKDSSKGSYLLVYELMSNGSLDKVLFGEAGKERVSLSWEKRYNIVMGTAKAVDYLHEGWKQQVLHRDIKSSNIMLDENWNPKLGDFGLARLVDHERTAATTVVAGTYGYIAPEVAASGKFTDKSDVFAFGAVVLEVACGRKALERDASPQEILLADWVWKSLSDGHLLSTVDKNLTDYNMKEMGELLIVGLLCSHPNPLARPSMRHVVQILAGEVPVPSIPASKPSIFFSSDTGENLITFDDLLQTTRKSISLVSTNFSERTGPSPDNSS